MKYRVLKFFCIHYSTGWNKSGSCVKRPTLLNSCLDAARAANALQWITAYAVGFEPESRLFERSGLWHQLVDPLHQLHLHQSAARDFIVLTSVFHVSLHYCHHPSLLPFITDSPINHLLHEPFSLHSRSVRQSVHQLFQADFCSATSRKRILGAFWQ